MHSVTAQPEVARLGRIAGGLYLLFAVIFVLGSGIVSGANPNSNTFRIGIGFELLGDVLGLVTALGLYALLRRVDQVVALTMVAIAGMGSAAFYAVHVVQYSTHSASLPGADEASSMFSGLWLVPLGYLVLKSRYFPKIVGIALLVAAALWLAQFALYFFGPFLHVNGALFSLGGIGELFFVAWLLIFSARPPVADGGLTASPSPLHESK